MSTQLTTKTNDLRSIITNYKMKQQFSAALPRDIAASVIAERMTDPAAAAEVCQAAIRTSL